MPTPRWIVSRQGNFMELHDKVQLLESVFAHYGLSLPSSRRKILCPVHDEKVPSAIASPDRGSWHCFACQKEGDGYDIIQLRESIGFVDAVKFADQFLDRSGSTVQRSLSWKSSSGVSGGSGDRRERIRYRPSWMD